MPCRDPYPFYEAPASLKPRTETSSEQINNNSKLYGLPETDEDLPGRLVKRLGLGRDIDYKLDQVISLAENLKTSSNSIS